MGRDSGSGQIDRVVTRRDSGSRYGAEGRDSGSRHSVEGFGDTPQQMCRVGDNTPEYNGGSGQIGKAMAEECDNGSGQIDRMVTRRDSGSRHSVEGFGDTPQQMCRVGDSTSEYNDGSGQIGKAMAEECDNGSRQIGRAMAEGCDSGSGQIDRMVTRRDNGSGQIGRAMAEGCDSGSGQIDRVVTGRDSGSGYSVRGFDSGFSQIGRAMAEGCDNGSRQIDRVVAEGCDNGSGCGVEGALEQRLREHILVLDGAVGTMIEAMSLSESDYRGERFADWNVPLKGCCDALTLSYPEIIKDLHRQYLEAGADIITTNTLLSNASSLSDRGLGGYAYKMNRSAAIVAREAIDEFMMACSLADGIDSAASRQRFVAGVVGPIRATALPSHSIKGFDGDAESLFEEMVEVYRGQMSGLLDGGVDVILVETIIDVHSAMAAVEALRIETMRSGVCVPLILSATISKDGTLYSGQTVEEFYELFTPANPLAIGINCSYGVAHIAPYLERLKVVAKCYLSAHPNAGMPDSSGLYDSSELFVEQVAELLERGLVDIVGGCCGTTPAHIAKLAELIKG